MKITTTFSTRLIRVSVATALCLSLAGPTLAAQEGSSRFISPAGQEGSSIKAQEGSSRFVSPAGQEGSSIKAQEGSSRFVSPAAQEGSSRLQTFLQVGVNLMHMFAQQGSSRISTPALQQGSRTSGVAGSSSFTKQRDACEIHQLAGIFGMQEAC